MLEMVKGTMHGKTIELEQDVSLPDGSQVLVSIEPLPLSEAERRSRLCALAGTWKGDPSLREIFDAIEKERRGSTARMVPFA
jgi:hypothetical protein